MLSLEPFSQHEDFEKFVHAVCTEGERPDLDSKKVKALVPAPIRDVISKTWVPNPDERPSTSHMTSLLAFFHHSLVLCSPPVPCPSCTRIS
jgi:hypothetical protein